MSLCGAAGFTPRIEQEARELNTVLGLVSAGLGIAVLPECYVCMAMPGVSSRPIPGVEAESWLMIAMRERSLPPLLQRFVDVVCNLGRADAPELVPSTINEHAKAEPARIVKLR
jgi:DNA-binding transcriptional LysR family regulator